MFTLDRFIGGDSTKRTKAYTDESLKTVRSFTTWQDADDYGLNQYGKEQYVVVIDDNGVDRGQRIPEVRT